MPNSLVDSLVAQGWSPDRIRVLPLARSEWLQVFWRGALDYRFWFNIADPTRPAFRWYLERIANQVQDMTQDDDDGGSNGGGSGDGGGGVILVGHSAGGWLGRAALGFGSDGGGDDQDDATRPSSSSLSSSSSRKSSSSGPSIDLTKVLGLVSLGAPHLPPPPDIMDMTRGALRITHERFPGAFHLPTDDVFYVTAIGLAIQGQEQERTSLFLEPTTVQGFAYNSYQAVCGDGTTVGDGVVPACSAHLDDAVQLDLDGVLHSINAPDRWYGSTNVIEQWHGPMLKELQRRSGKVKTRRRKGGNGHDATANFLGDAVSKALEGWK